jgi:hypothetical protein
MVRGVSMGALIALWVALILIATAFGHLHRYGSVDLLLLVCLLMGLWVLSSLMAAPLRYVRSWVNPLLWAVLLLVLSQITPLPGLRGIVGDQPSGGVVGVVLTDGLHDFFRAHPSISSVGRYSLRPIATSGALILMASAAALYWLLASSLAARHSIRSVTWVVALGLVPLALWVILSGLARPSEPESEIFRPSSPVLILGGDSLVPALMAALPLSMAVVLRLLGWMPMRRHEVQGRRWDWFSRAAPIWAAIGLILVLLMAVALGMSNVPRGQLAVSVILAVGFVLVWYASLRGPTFHLRRRPRWFTVGLVLWIFLGLGLGHLIGPAQVPARSGDAVLEKLVNHNQSGAYSALGIGAGAISTTEAFGTAGWPYAAGDDCDTSGYLVLRAEIGWVGFFLVLVAAAAMGVFLLRAWRRSVSPWPRLMLLVGLGVLASNLYYFRYDASALLAPNLLALAAVMGVVTAWAAHGLVWRTQRTAEFRRAHWPLVFGATGLIAAMALAENEMLSVSPSHDINDKVMHFGAFGVVSLLLCYALDPRPDLRRLTGRILLATALASLMAVGVEYGQWFLTENRNFEWMDAFWSTAGAVLIGGWWWLMRRAHVFETSDSLPASSDALSD